MVCLLQCFLCLLECGGERSTSLFLLAEDCFTGLLEKTSGQPAKQLSQAGLQRHNLVGGQALDELLRQYLLRLAQGIGFYVMQTCQRRTNGFSPTTLERLREQERDGLFSQSDEALAHFCHAV